MPASRPYWKGYLKLSLVSCPIALYTASASSERIAFRQINKKTGNRLRQQLVDEVTREPVETEDKGRGYEVAKNTYIPIDDAELEAVEIESNQTIEIDSFVPRAQIDERYLDSPYYIVPNDQVGQEAFAVIREAMRDKSMVALGRIVLAKRERVVMLQAWDRGLMGTTLRYPYELRDSHDYFDEIPDVKVPKEMLSLAEHIVDTKTADFNPATFVDRYEDAVIDMLKKKQAGAPLPQARPVHAPNVINLMDALRRSIGAGGTGAAQKAPATQASEPSASAPAAGEAKKTRRAKTPKPEELRNAPQFKFPIAGGKGKGKEQPAKEQPAKDHAAKAPQVADLPKPRTRRKSA